MARIILSLLVIGFAGLTTNVQANETTDKCLKNVSDALTALPNSEYIARDCTLQLKVKYTGGTFRTNGSVEAACTENVSALSKVHFFTDWSVHFKPGPACEVASIAPESAPPAALQTTTP